MSMLTQDLPSLPVVTEAMDRFGLYENYSGSSSYATPSNYAGPSDNAGPSSYVDQSNYAGPSSNAGPSTYNEEDDDPEGDSFLNNELSNSELDEVEEEDQIDNNHENDDDVGIDIMLDVLGNNADVPPTPVHDHFDLNMPAVSVPPYNLYPVPPFFSTTHPEIPADSIDVPTGNWGHFYDSNTGELSLGMVFKSKDHLKASIQDFSVRHARREYKVVESNPKLWKVCCKWDVETGCNWMLRGIFKSNMGLFKITRYAGLHTCLMNEISVDHGNLGKSMIATHLLESSARRFDRIMEEIKGLNEEAYDWLGNIDKTQWTLAHDGGWRTGILMTNISEAASRHFGMNASNFIPQYFNTQAYKKTYQKRFEPMYGEEYWDPVHFELVHNPTKQTRRGPGLARREYGTKWIGHKDVPANNIKLVKLR
ncbi:UNVERIFIED_CONTAM: hypothetical protein Slati_0503500 [Sesamum latifolium]|uniref:Transposase MuDR plant domain-containing protein n=1 Tax=Sesamum latifolium TaxID=2727402 RepID=A0AAW2XYA6_9LAMI